MMTVDDISRLTTAKSFSRILESRYDNNCDRLVADIDAGLSSLIRADLKKAEKYLGKARACFKHLPGQYRPRLTAMQARLYHWSGRYHEADREYLKAAAQYAEQRDYLNAARIRKALVEVFMYLGRYDMSLEQGRQALKYFRTKDIQGEAAQVMTNMGNAYHRMDRNRQALQYYEKARRIFEKQGGVPLAVVDYNRANVYANLNDLGKAERLYLASAAIYNKAGMGIAEAQAIYSVAYLNFLRDQYTEALKLFDRVYDSFSQLGDDRSAAMTQLDVVEINVHLNQFGSAIMIGELLIPQFRATGMVYEEAKANYFVALARMAMGDYRDAAKQLAASERLFTRENNGLWLGMVLQARARLLVARKRYAQAAEVSAQAKKSFMTSGDQRRGMDAEIVRLEALMRSQRAQPALRRATALLKGRLGSAQRYKLNYLVGERHFDDGRFAFALKHFLAAIKTVEVMVTGLYADEIRYFFLADKYPVYTRAVETLIKLNRVEEAFLRNLEAVRLINYRAVSKSRLRAEVPRELIEEQDRLRLSLRRLEEYPRSGQRGTTDPVSYVSAEQKLWAQQRKIRSHLYPAGGELSDAISIEDVRHRIPRGYVVINFVEFGRGIGAFVSTSLRTRFKLLTVSTADLELMTRKLHFLMEKSVTRTGGHGQFEIAIKESLIEIRRAMVDPVIQDESAEGLIFMVDGTFAQIPFAALSTADGTMLKDRYDLAVTVSPDEIGNGVGSKVHLQKKSSAVFAVPSESLPLVRTEGEKIKEIFPEARLYSGERAGSKHLSEELERATGFVHIAAHASRSSENPLFSRILMSDGPFFPFDLFTTGISARLVVLSGCQTAAPGLYYGNSFSLAKAFYQAGAQFVLASLWPVSDRFTMHFMTAFYEALSSTDDIQKSYFHAIDRSRELSDDPALWGSFVLLGV